MINQPLEHHMTMTLIGHTLSGALLFSPGPGDDPCLVCVVDQDSCEMSHTMPLADLCEPYEIVQPYDRDAWDAMFATDADDDIAEEPETD